MYIFKKMSEVQCSICEKYAEGIDRPKYNICYDCLDIKMGVKDKYLITYILETSTHGNGNDSDIGYHSGEECRYYEYEENITVEFDKGKEVSKDLDDWMEPPIRKPGYGECVCCRLSDKSKEKGLGCHDYRRTLKTIEKLE